MGERKSFPFYISWRRSIDRLNDSQAGLLIKAILAYQEDGEIILGDDSAASFVFDTMLGQFQADIEKYNKKVKDNHDRASKGGKTTQARALEKRANAHKIEANASQFRANAYDFEAEEGEGVGDGVDDGADDDAVAGDHLNPDAIYDYFNKRTSNHIRLKDDSQKADFIQLLKIGGFDTNQKAFRQIDYAWKKASEDISLLPKLQPFSIFRDEVFL